MVLQRERCMSNNNNSSSSVNFGAVTVLWLLTAVLVVLKLVGKITLSWFWVLFPAAFSLGVTLIIIGILLFIGILVAMLK
jgi:hypothetical protein